MLQDFWHSLRLLRRTPGFTSVAILVLALGIGANTAVFSVVNALVLQPRPGRIDQLVGVYSRDRTRPDHYRDFAYPAYVDLRSRADVFESVMAHTFSTVGITESPGSDVTKETFAAIVSANYFSTLGVRMAVGRAFTLDEERPRANARVVIASYSVWRRMNFDPGFVGRTVRANGSDYTVIGVAQRGFAGTMTLVSPEWWFPLGSFDIVVNEMFKQRATGLADRGNYALNLAAALRPGVTREAAERVLDAYGKQLDVEYPATDKDQTFVLGNLPRLSVGSKPQSAGPINAFGALLMFMAALVLIVACLNLANLLLARGTARRREMAIRQALGSGRRRIVQQLLVEGLTLSLVGAAAGVVVGRWATGALSAWLASVLPLGIDVVIAESSPRLIAAGVGFAIFSTICFALGPAWALSRPALQGDLKGELRSSARLARRFGTAPLLVVGQLAVALALVAAGGLFVRAALTAGRADPGFSLQRHLIVSMDPSLAGYDQARTTSFYRSALDRVRSLPGVEHASVASIVPYGEFEEDRAIRLKPGDDGVSSDFVIVGSDYFATLGVHVLRGREFTRAEEQPGTTSRAVIIDRPLARKLFKDGDPLDQQILIAGREGEAPQARTIVGVVSEMAHDTFDTEPPPHVFVPSGSMFRAMLTLHVRTAAGVPDAAMLAALRRELLGLNARLPILTATTMADYRYRSLTEWTLRAAATLFGVFGVLALLLATIGVYGLKAYDVARRTREIGIRMALGATSGDVKRLMLREGLRTTMAGLGIGLLLAAGIGKLVSGLLYRVSPFDPLALVSAAAVLATTALLASYVPARRATRVEPLLALRSE